MLTIEKIEKLLNQFKDVLFAFDRENPEMDMKRKGVIMIICLSKIIGAHAYGLASDYQSAVNILEAIMSEAKSALKHMYKDK